MQKTENYKQSEVGLIPEEWEVNSIGKICDIFVGRDLRESIFSKGSDSNYPYPVFSNTVENEGLYGFYKTPEYNGESLTIVGRGIGLGKSFARSGGFGAIGRLLVLFPKKGYNNQYLSYFINNRIKIFEESGGIPQLTGISISKYFISFPPLPEQTAIASALSDMDALIAQTEKLIEKKKAIKQGVMQELLTGKKRLKGFENSKGYKQTEVGVIPEDWEVLSIDSIFDFYSTSNYSKAEMSLEGEVGCIHYGLIHAISDTGYNLQRGIKFFIKPEQAKYEGIKDGDVVMVDASEDMEGVNKSIEVFGVNNKRFIAGLHTYLLRDNKLRLANNFRGAILNSSLIKNQLNRLAVGMKVFGVSKPQLKTVLIPVPPIPEQTAIASALSDMDEDIRIRETKLQKLKLQKQGMMQALLTGKIRLI